MGLTNNINIVKIIDIVSKHESINRIGIFGSYARGEYTGVSDIDLLYDYDDLKINDTIKCLGEIQCQIDTDIDFVAYEDLFDINNEYDVHFINLVLNDVIWIYTNKMKVGMKG